MLVSRKYLSQYFDLTSYTDEELANCYTKAGLEVEKITSYHFENLVVGKILSFSKHVDSDHLNICQVDIGNEVLQIVCGASNVRENAYVIVALPGCQLKEITIKKSTIRGVDSCGMLCSLAELGLPEDMLSEEEKKGIYLFKKDIPLGTNPLIPLGYDDTIFEIGLTPNRKDCLALDSLVKETGAILRQLPKKQQIEKVDLEKVHYPFSVEINSEGCSYFSATYIPNIEINTLEGDVISVLTSQNMVSINNIVDISNLALLKYAQPNHFYDASLVKGCLIVRDDYEGEFVALDGNTYQIEKGDLMIFDEEKPLGIAGIIGGEFSKVVSSTKAVILEMAIFDRVRIRNTARRLHLQTQASIRYQKGIEPLAIEKAREYIFSLLSKYAGAKSCSVIYENDKRKKYVPAKIKFDLNHMNHYLGTKINSSQVEEIFNFLQFTYHQNEVTIPSDREDISIREDLYEEIMRLVGYDQLTSSLVLLEKKDANLTKIQKIQRSINKFLCNNGLYQTITYTLVGDRLNNLVEDSEKAISLASAMSEERKYVRRAILPSLLEILATNQSYNQQNMGVFEYSDVYSSQNNQHNLAIAIMGNVRDNLWLHQNSENNFYFIKGICMSLLESLGINQNRIFIRENKDTSLFHPYQSAKLFVDKNYIGSFGMIHPSVCKDFDLPKISALEINLSILSAIKTAKISYKPISLLPSTKRDLALIVPKEVSFEEVRKIMKSCGGANVETIELFDVYEGTHVKENHVSLAIRIVFKAINKTLTANDIQIIVDKMLLQLKNKLNVEIRGVKNYGKSI